jgi:ribosomal protein S18 acetylase RimI-like enzyme
MTLLVRPAAVSDAELLGRLGAALMRQHHGFDPQRFMVPPPDAEKGYASWLDKERRSKTAVVLVVEVDGEVKGYAYGRLEGRDWNMLLEPHGALHDIYVDPKARGQGAGGALLRAMLSALESKGAPRVLLNVATQNENARALFAKAGFRPTMVEMTREAGS